MDFPCNGFNVFELHALALAETNGDAMYKGSGGERTQYAIRPEEWAKYSGLQFTPSNFHSSTAQTAFFLAWQHDIMCKFVAGQGKLPNRAEMYAIWRIGWRRFKAKGFNIQACNKAIQDKVMLFLTMCHMTETRN